MDTLNVCYTNTHFLTVSPAAQNKMVMYACSYAWSVSLYINGGIGVHLSLSVHALN